VFPRNFAPILILKIKVRAFLRASQRAINTKCLQLNGTKKEKIFVFSSLSIFDTFELQARMLTIAMHSSIIS